MHRYEGIRAALVAPLLLCCSCSLNLGQAFSPTPTQPVAAATPAVQPDPAATPQPPVSHLSPLLQGLPTEEVARIQAGDRYLAYLDTGLELQKTRLELLRVTGQLLEWALPGK